MSDRDLKFMAIGCGIGLIIYLLGYMFGAAMADDKNLDASWKAYEQKFDSTK